MYIVDSVASLHLTGGISVSSQERKPARQTKHHLEIQTAKGIVLSTEKATVYILELGTCACIWWKLPFRPFLLDDVSIIWCDAYSWQSRGNPTLRNGKKIITGSSGNFVLVVMVTQQKVTPSTRHDHAKGNPVPDEVVKPC